MIKEIFDDKAFVIALVLAVVICIFFAILSKCEFDEVKTGATENNSMLNSPLTAPILQTETNTATYTDFSIKPNTEPVREEYDIPDDNIRLLAKLVWGEARGCSAEEQKLVVWTVFNRMLSHKFPYSVQEVVEQSGQFTGYSKDNPVEHDIYKLCEKESILFLNGESAPVLSPYANFPGYFYFEGINGHNWFREEY